MNERDVDRDDFDRDDELRALLRSADPVGSLPPADPAALAHLLEDIMSADLEVRPIEPDEGTRATGTHGRNRLTWLVAAAATAMIAGVGGFAIAGLSGDDSPPPQASDRRTSSTNTTAAGGPLAGVTTELTAKTPAGRCAVATPELLALYDQAFQGTVTAVDGDTVTLQATDVFNGEVGETVQVSAPTADMQALVAAVSFQVGGTYLVSAFEGSVSTCPGFSGPASGNVQQLYAEAFVR